MKNPWKAKSKVNPQRENGHRRINSDIWHALTLVNITSAAYKIVLTIIDRTWGFDLSEAPIGYSAFAKSTGLTKVSIRNGIKEAEKKHLIVVETGNYKSSAKYLFNKHYDTWLGITVLNINTGKAKIPTPGKANSTRGGIPATKETSLPTENIIENIYKKGNSSFSIKNKKDDVPDRSGKYFGGKYGHMVRKK